MSAPRLFLCGLAAALAALCPPPSAAATFEDGKGLFNRRLGMFIHWGIYSVGAWHEQEFMRMRMSRADYERCRDRFTAEKFSADHFVDVAESAGAEYIVFTAKHHDGFCMWDTKTTDYKSTNVPAKKDLVAELANACRRRGMKLGFYFSNPDWHQPFSHNALSTHQVPLQPGDVPDRAKYIAYVKAQVAELLTNYGEIVCFFWDIPTRIELPEMDALVRKLQPGIMVNDRGWGNKGTCDYSTPEREVPPGSLFPRPTEACDSVGACSWGYRANEDYRTVGYLTRSIDAILSMGGNYLLNVGPRPDGTIPEKAVDRMARVGAWYRKVRESYRNVDTVTNLVADGGCYTTVRGKTVYLHYPKGLNRDGVDLSPLDKLPRSAVLLNTGASLPCEVVWMPGSSLRLNHPCLHVSGIPADDLANESVVIKLEF